MLDIIRIWNSHLTDSANLIKLKFMLTTGNKKVLCSLFHYSSHDNAFQSTYIKYIIYNIEIDGVSANLLFHTDSEGLKCFVFTDFFSFLNKMKWIVSVHITHFLSNHISAHIVINKMCICVLLWITSCSHNRFEALEFSAIQFMTRCQYPFYARNPFKRNCCQTSSSIRNRNRLKKNI